MGKDEPLQDQNKFSLKKVIRFIASALGILALLACSIFGMQVVGGIILGVMMSMGGDSVLHSDPNPDNSIVIHVISDDCGATCDCSTRLDITFDKETKEEIYRVQDACDLEINWLDDYRFEVIDKWGETVVLDARDYEITP